MYPVSDRPGSKLADAVQHVAMHCGTREDRLAELRCGGAALSLSTLRMLRCNNNNNDTTTTTNNNNYIYIYIYIITYYN